MLKTTGSRSEALRLQAPVAHQLWRLDMNDRHDNDMMAHYQQTNGKCDAAAAHSCCDHVVGALGLPSPGGLNEPTTWHLSMSPTSTKLKAAPSGEAKWVTSNTSKKHSYQSRTKEKKRSQSTTQTWESTPFEQVRTVFEHVFKSGNSVELICYPG